MYQNQGCYNYILYKVTKLSTFIFLSIAKMLMKKQIPIHSVWITLNPRFGIGHWALDMGYKITSN